jgi:hypothetical protein
MIDDRTQAVLAEILGDQRPYAADGADPVRDLAPGFAQLTELATLLGDESTPEEQLQRFFAAHPEFLLGFVPRSSGLELALLSKPPIGTQYKADFAILAAGQAGASTYLFELEVASATLFTKELIEARSLRTAIGQVRDWQQWIDGNQASFTKDMLRLAREAPLYPKKSSTGSFRLMPPEQLMRNWDGYGSVEYPGAIYTIVIGRWARLSPAERRRLLFLNQQESNGARIITYDQVARAAYHRPHRSPENDLY